MHASIGLIQINVLDSRKAREFYLETLGFTEKKMPVELGPVTVLDNGEGAPILLYPVEKRAEVDYPSQTGATLVFYVEEIARTYREWKEKGVEFVPISWSKEESGIAPCPFGPFIAFRDPFGNVHEILEPWPGQAPVAVAGETLTA